MKQVYCRYKIVLLFVILLVFQNSKVAFSQIPKPALIGYWQTWSNRLKLTDIDDNYNIIDIAFATTVGNSLCNMTFSLPDNYTQSTFIDDIDVLHAEGKLVILSIGGANDPVRLDNTLSRDTFVTTINSILANYEYKFDGIDITFENAAMAFGNTWTLATPAAGQTNLIDAIKAIKLNYETQKGKRMLLTTTPETLYLMGALSSYQINHVNGGAMIPIIQALNTDLDLLVCQFYNAGGATGGTKAIDGGVYYDDSDPDYITSMAESLIIGFKMLNNKGTYTGIPEDKIAIGLPAKSANCTRSGTGYNTPENVCAAVKYLQGKITKPTDWSYTLKGTYPNLAGLMAWSINDDDSTCEGSYTFAKNFACAFPQKATSINESSLENDYINLYPNPNNGVLNLQISKYTSSSPIVRISNILGVEVYSSNLREDQNSLQLDLTTNPPGVYILEYSEDERKLSKRIIIK